MTWQTLVKHLKKKGWHFDKWRAFVSSDTKPLWHIFPSYDNKHSEVNRHLGTDQIISIVLPNEFVEEYIDLMERIKQLRFQNTER